MHLGANIPTTPLGICCITSLGLVTKSFLPYLACNEMGDSSLWKDEKALGMGWSLVESHVQYFERVLIFQNEALRANHDLRTEDTKARAFLAVQQCLEHPHVVNCQHHQYSSVSTPVVQYALMALSNGLRVAGLSKTCAWS
jgi:hypothetical protein